MTKIVMCCALLALPLALTAQRQADLPEDPATTLVATAGAYAVTSPSQVSSSAETSPSAQASTPAQPPAAAGQTGSVTPAAQTPEDQRTARQRQIDNEEKQRMLGIMPEFNVVNSGTALPISTRDKFDLWFHSAIDPFTFGLAAVDAGIEQAENTYPTWHQGLIGYSKRFGSSYADNVDGNFWGNAVLPSLLHQDPRYFRKGQGSIKGRIWYAAISTVRCKGDNGRWQPNYSNVLGNLIGGGISNIYYPKDNRGAGLTFERGLTVTAEGSLGAFAEEFYPDFIRLLHRHKKQ